MWKKEVRKSRNLLLINLLYFFQFSLLLSSCSFEKFIAKNKTVDYCYYYRFKGTKLKLKETITLFQGNSFNVNREGLDLGVIVLIESKGFFEQSNQFLILTCYDRDNIGTIKAKDIQDTTIRPQIRNYYYFSNRRFFILNRNTLVNKENGKYFYFKRCKVNNR
jgi:hypothetical protein